MVAKIKIGKSIRGIIHYNESKVAEGKANLILASGFAGDIEKMGFHNKIKRFQHLNGLKPSIKTNALHISLNFEASEKIDNIKMQQIAIAYMELIGFGDQPYLVYRHNDVAHQHIHIATTSIQRDGQSISLHNIGREISEPARKQIEKDFNLVVAESKTYKPYSAIKPIDPEIINYGHIPTKRAINNVIGAVIDNYKFTSLAEFNALLKQFNLIADRGNEGTEMFEKKGLQYAILTSKGEKVGVPIKASSFYSKPTLRNIEKKFEKNLEKRKPYKQELVNRIDKVLTKFNTVTEKTLIMELKKVGVDLVLRKNEQGLIYGTTFIDHFKKTVFNGSALGKAYSAKAISGVITNKDEAKTYLKRENIHSTTYLEPIAKTNYLSDLLGRAETDIAPTVGKSRRKKRRGIRR